jgi:hypothetical protein
MLSWIQTTRAYVRTGARARALVDLQVSYSRLGLERIGWLATTRF